MEKEEPKTKEKKDKKGNSSSKKSNKENRETQELTNNELIKDSKESPSIKLKLLNINHLTTLLTEIKDDDLDKAKLIKRKEYLRKCFEIYNQIGDLVKSEDESKVNEIITEEDKKEYNLLEEIKEEENEDDKEEIKKEEEKKILPKKEEEKEEEEVEDTGCIIPSFWLDAFKNCGFFTINKKDEKILSSLNDVKLFVNEDFSELKISFYFDKNESFDNSVITKTYFYEKDGDVVIKVNSDVINWKSEEKNPCLKKKRKKGSKEEKYFETDSFFDMFNSKKTDIEDEDSDLSYLIEDFFPNLFENYMNFHMDSSDDEY